MVVRVDGANEEVREVHAGWGAAEALVIVEPADEPLEEALGGGVDGSVRRAGRRAYMMSREKRVFLLRVAAREVRVID